MSYPVPLILGSGDPQVQIVGREYWGVAGVLTLAHPKEYDITFAPERRDGGAVQVRLSDGRLLNRYDAWRMTAALGWEGLTTAQTAQIQHIWASGRTRDVWFNPHFDVDLWIKVVATGEWSPGLTGGLYVGHSPRLTLVSVGLVALPYAVGDGVEIAGVVGNYGIMPI